MSTTLLRQWAMLQKVPRYPRRISTRELLRHLEDEGFSISQRSIQRDLNMLSEIFVGLESDGNQDEAGWYWIKDCQLYDFPSIDPHMALTFKLVENYLKPLIPPVVMDKIQPYMKKSDAVLAALNKQGVKDWKSRVHFFSRTQSLVPANIDEDVVHVIYESILNHKQFRGWYKGRNNEEKEYEFHPLGLVVQESVTYLVASVWGYDDLRHYALHRFVRCECSGEIANVPDNFDIKEYVSTGTFEYVLGKDKAIKLVVLMDKITAVHLGETPLSQDQCMSKCKDGRVRITATVKNSEQLRWWLLGFGENVEVIKPGKLRAEFKNISKSMNKIYR